MAIGEILVRLVGAEPAADHEIVRVETHRKQADPFDWHWLFFRRSTDDASRRLADLCAPLRKGEMLFDIDRCRVWVPSNGFLLEEYLIDDPYVERYACGARAAIEEVVEHAGGPRLGVRLLHDESLRDLDALVARVIRETWLGMRIHPGIPSDRRIELVLGAQHRVVVPANESPIADNDLENVSFAFFRASSASRLLVRIWRPGHQTVTMRIKVRDVLWAIGIPDDRYYGFKVELSLSVDVCSDRALSLGELLLLFESSASRLAALRTWCIDAINDSVENTARRLDERRDALARRRRLWVTNGAERKSVGLVPSNENEVLILVGRLHSHIESTIHRFGIQEHTALLGIDARADIQMLPDGSMFQSATVAFEFSLDNFFRHEHPIRQTSFIICWTIGNGLPVAVDYRRSELGEGARGSFQHRISLQRRGWRRRLNFGDHLIHVMVLEFFPWIEVTEQ